MAKSIFVPFELPSEFSPDRLSDVIRACARQLLRTAVQAGPGTPIFRTGKASNAAVASRISAGARDDDRDRQGAGSGSACA